MLGKAGEVRHKGIRLLQDVVDRRRHRDDIAGIVTGAQVPGGSHDFLQRRLIHEVIELI